MSPGLLPDHIEPLVDRLRSGDHLPIALPDVAAVTEVLMRSLESYIKSIDFSLYKECQELADYIEDARTEISSLSTDGEDSAGIPRAGKELDAIVDATESATDTIMQAAEDLMSFENDDFDEYKNHVNTEVMKIFEACSFQDITGQRISKVVKTLNHVEDRVGKLISILGTPGDQDIPKDAKPILEESNEVSDDDLLNGPALAGEGIDQGEIDTLLDSFEEAPIQDESEDIQESSPNDVEMNSPEDASEELIDDEIDVVQAEESEGGNSDEDNVDLQEEVKLKEKPLATSKTVDVKSTVKNDNQETTSQQDIDSLFG